ncbi:1-acyl-sn-glycerol-3-phosphate acyltransferase [Legionella quinlivanii]|uniref:1-acyl-sn-glycerol-3-phosphate acyltransferase n=1 Tax=Legionella quinlivanii TaxID=45073 RepID=A0A0W0Y5L4_9GAMM|nr:lysophospholipid acyltransferase family protein [Legionella quinlivanii]KTD52283.1 1-acyl-sn-glycerol-3-phosphate acyltransferase [Legionella quinlivanii]MCW8449633.1 1-acyl-sn-glycerol-3-phosphate acyltransferase [Legionella quinlivanii]SEF73613.1 1-acyl-sn-glycerol-3-phosphate acyltransferase [Legionella quinlivanii DSM 21216]STY12217.1 1-acyl-sn-glycerol-3-phosphate acyltransferase [Legionella quinlivanii]
MKISKLRTLWISLVSVGYTANACSRAIFKSWRGNITRPWVDQVIRHWSDKLLKLIGVQCKIINPGNVAPVAGKPTILMCNHTSLYDIPLGFKAFPNHSIRMLAKRELSRIPIMGKGMAAAEFPFIDRHNRHQAIKDLAEARQLMESGIVIWIAPEGTRSKNGRLAAFKKGAFITAIQSQAMIIPIGIRGAYNILPAHTMQFNINQTAEIHIGEAIDASQYTMETRDELVERVHKVMEQLVGESSNSIHEPANELNHNLSESEK